MLSSDKIDLLKRGSVLVWVDEFLCSLGAYPVSESDWEVAYDLLVEQYGSTCLNVPTQTPG
jgi:hypothetical protein